MCIANSKIVADHAKRFAHGHWSFLWPGSEKKWYGTHTRTNRMDNGVAEVMMLNFSDTGHPVFRASSALQRGDLKSKRTGNLSVHFCGDDKKRLKWFFARSSRQSAQYLRSSSGHVRRAGLQNL